MVRVTLREAYLGVQRTFGTGPEVAVPQPGVTAAGSSEADLPPTGAGHPGRELADTVDAHGTCYAQGVPPPGQDFMVLDQDYSRYFNVHRVDVSSPRDYPSHYLGSHDSSYDMRKLLQFPAGFIDYSTVRTRSLPLVRSTSHVA